MCLLNRLAASGIGIDEIDDSDSPEDFVDSDDDEFVVSCFQLEGALSLTEALIRRRHSPPRMPRY